MLGKSNRVISLAVVAAAVIIAGALIYIGQNSSVKGLPMETATEKAMAYINANLLGPGMTAFSKEVTDEGTVYKIHLEIKEGENVLGEFDSYVSKDGKLLFPEGHSLEESVVQGAESQAEGNQDDLNLSGQELETLAKCLTEEGAKFYGAYWCSWCAQQKEMFGAAAQFLPYVECEEQGSQELTPDCQTAGISSYPTWEFDGQKAPGFRSLEDLISLSGCTV